MGPKGLFSPLGDSKINVFRNVIGVIIIIVFVVIIVTMIIVLISVIDFIRVINLCHNSPQPPKKYLFERLFLWSQCHLGYNYFLNMGR